MRLSPRNRLRARVELCMSEARLSFLALTTPFTTSQSQTSAFSHQMEIVIFAKNLRKSDATFVAKMSVKTAARSFFHFSKITDKMKTMKIVV